MRLGAEEKIQAKIIAELHRRYECLVVHVPNGGYRSKTEAVRLKETGVTAGHPDLIVYRPGGGVYLIEVKAPGGTISPAQKAFGSRLRRWSFNVAVVFSVEEALKAAEIWCLPPRREETAPEGVAVRF